MNNNSLPNVVTNRTLIDYEDLLLFNAQELENKKIHVIGAGGTNIQDDFKNRNIDSSIIVHSDIKNSPIVKGIPQIINIIRKNFLDIIGVENTNNQKNFVQTDASSLGFSDKSFDVTLSLWIIHQIPSEHKEEVICEMMRTSKKIHIGPIYKEEFEIIKKLCLEKNFEISNMQHVNFTIGSYIRSKTNTGKIYETYRSIKSRLSNTLENKNDRKYIEFPEENNDNNIYFNGNTIFTRQGQAYTCIINENI